VTPEQFRAAFRKVHPAGAGQEPTEAQRRANLTAVSSRRLDVGLFCSSFNFSWTALAYPLPPVGVRLGYMSP